MRMSARLMFACVAGMILLLAAEPALARVVRRSGHSNRRSSYRSARSNYGNNSASAYNSLAASAQRAAAAAATARAETSRAESALNNRVFSLKRSYESSGECAAAQAELKAAYTALDTAKAPILDALSRDANYQAAAAEKARLQELVRSAREGSGGADGGGPQSLGALARAVMDHGSIVLRMESERLNADTAVRDARARLVAAQSRVDELRRQFEASISTDSQWQSTSRALADARVKRTATAAVAANANAALRNYVPPRPQPYRYGSGYRRGNTHRTYRR